MDRLKAELDEIAACRTQNEQTKTEQTNKHELLQKCCLRTFNRRISTEVLDVCRVDVCDVYGDKHCFTDVNPEPYS